MVLDIILLTCCAEFILRIIMLLFLAYIITVST